MSRACLRSTRKRHVKSVDVISWLYLDTWAFLKQVVMEGMSRPPLALERKICAGSTDLLRPHYFFRSLVASGSNVQVSGSAIGHMRLDCGVLSQKH